MASVASGFIAAVLVAALLASAAQGLTGFGFALIAMPILLLVVDVREAVVVSTALGTVSVALVSARSWRETAWPLVGRLLAGSFAGMPAGLAVLLLAPEEALRLGVGLAVLAMAGALAAGVRIRGSGAPLELAVGVVSGVLRTSSSLAGPPVVAYLQARAFAPAAFRATVAVFFSIGNVVALVAFGASGAVSRDALVGSAIALPVVVAGVAVGERLLARTDAALFRRVVIALLVATALSSVALSLQRLVG